MFFRKYTELMIREKEYVTGIGEILWDLLPEGKQLGGAPANFAYHVSQFGLGGCVVSAVGNDQLGQEIKAQLIEKDIDSLIAEVPFPTGTVTVELDKAGVPRYDIKKNVAWDNIPFTPELEEIARRTKAVCFGSLAQRSIVSRDTIFKFLDAMKSGADTLRVFDVNLRQNFYSKDVLTRSFQYANIVKINDEELEELCRMYEIGGDSIAEKARVLLELFDLRILILTCGLNGSYVFAKGETSFLPTPEVEVADTVGAGDSFTASFIASLLQGISLPEAHEIAVATSAYICMNHGAMPPLPENLIRRCNAK